LNQEFTAVWRQLDATRRPAPIPAPSRAWGAEILPDRQVRFRTWAPSHAALHLRLEDDGEVLPMDHLGAGWHEVVTDRAIAGTRYRYLLPDGRALADPASLCQPAGVDGPSEVLELPRPRSGPHAWQGRPWHEAVIYELHVGTFTPEGTFVAAVAKLAHLAALGVTAVELMPVAAFAGSRNWGYDGVFPYAPAASYGRPEELRAFIDAAHGHGLMVLLDVVYNHFGPEGCAMHDLAPDFFTERHVTPWGAGFNFDGEIAVRQYVVDNALYWIGNYGFDGLRIDAVHAIADGSPRHIIDEIAATVRATYPGRHVHLILGNHNNEAHRLARSSGRATRYTAQWNDDLHHVLHVAATGECGGYYADYVNSPQQLARALAEGFAFQGETMRYSGRARGEPSRDLPPQAFVSFLQNHDQIGNRAMGDRLAANVPAPALRALAAVQLLLPQVPMLFMGEEWGALQPFPFFCDISGELAESVREGRRNEFAGCREFSDPERRQRIPDPTSVQTFESARINWEEPVTTQGRTRLQWYRQLLAVRHREIIPRLARIRSGADHAPPQPGIVQVRWQLNDGGSIHLMANLSATSIEMEMHNMRRIIWREGARAGNYLAPWTVEWSLATG
jgi:malto-oligosyltrehalose trehalohydrolase